MKKEEEEEEEVKKKRAGVSRMWHGATYTCPYTHCAHFLRTLSHTLTHSQRSIERNVCAIR